METGSPAQTHGLARRGVIWALVGSNVEPPVIPFVCIDVSRPALLLLLLASCAHNAAILPGDARIAAAINALGDESIEVRDAAELNLLSFGESALPAVELAVQSEDPEVRVRAQRTARELRRRRSAANLKLVLHYDQVRRDYYRIAVPCSVTNSGPDPVVLVNAQFFYASRVRTAVRTAGSTQESRFISLVSRHGCWEIHPFDESDFVVIAPGKTRSIGTAELHPYDLSAGRYEVRAKYRFQKPETMDERQFANPHQRELYERALEIADIEAAPGEVVVPDQPPQFP